MSTKPHQCALALAIPLNRDDFLMSLDLSTDKDFVKSLARRNSALTEDALWEIVYADTVKTVISVAQAVSAKGVTVITNATLSDVRELFQKFRVVTLVAHWRAAKFYPADFLNPNQLIQALAQPSTPLIKTSVMRGI
jgi:2-keto-3-deoxy-6-phosphogluconate aldolase